MLLASAALGCSTDVMVYFDNTGSELMTVNVEGHDLLRIAPGEFGHVTCPPGRKRIEVKRGGEVVYHGAKDFQKSGSAGVTGRYFFNPDREARYLVYTVKYGDNPIEELVQNAMEASDNPEKGLRYAFEKLTKETILIPKKSWFEIPRGAYVLTDAPEVVYTRNFSETRRVLTRVDPELYATIATTLQKENPNEMDLLTLFEAVDQASYSPDELLVMED